MHFYWRVTEELKYLGEHWHIHDPSLFREYRRWLRKRSGAIAMLSGPHTSPNHVHPGRFSMLCGLN
ncbi:MAG: hypothetical protein JRG79_14900 [Deltaproteobacteria bacterium]|nr:hypothetical protein [Deltaproteobacteria bacterium]